MSDRALIWAGACLLACAPLVSADEVTLKDGRVVEGEVTQEDEKVVKLKMKKGTLTLDRKDIVGIVKKPTPDQEYAQRKAKLPAKDAKASLELATWCATKKLEAEAIAHFIEAHTLDATLKAAADELEKRDYHLVDGKWQDPDTYYAGKGWLKLNGQWYHPVEHAWRTAEQAATKAKDALAANREASRNAQAASNRAASAVDAENKKLEGYNADLAEANKKLESLRQAHETASQKVATADQAVKTGEVEFENSKAGEGGTLDALAKMRQLRRDLTAAKAAETKAEKAVADQEKKVASIQGQITDSTARSIDLSTTANDAKNKVTQLDGEAPQLEANVAEAKTKAAAARAEWEKLPK